MPSRALDPALAEIHDLLRRADADIFAHAERLQPIEIARRLAAEAVAGDVEDQAVRRDGPRLGGQGIDRIAGGRAQHEIGGRQGLGPVLAGIKRSTRAPISRSPPPRQQTQPSRWGKLFR